MALGAPARAIIRLALVDNVRPLLAGLAIGLGLSMAASRTLEGNLYGIGRLDPVAYAGVLALLSAAGVAASAIPARRAVRIDPARVLHAD